MHTREFVVLPRVNTSKTFLRTITQLFGAVGTINTWDGAMIAAIPMKKLHIVLE